MQKLLSFGTYITTSGQIFAIRNAPTKGPERNERRLKFIVTLLASRQKFCVRFRVWGERERAREKESERERERERERVSE